MKEIDCKKFRDILLKRKSQIEDNLIDYRKNAEGLHGSEPKDEGDSAFLSADNFTGNAIAKQQAQELEEIMVALSKIDTANYGICDMCEDEIGLARLEVKPYAKYCIDCREIVENSPIK